MPSVDCKNMPTHRALRIFKRKCDNAGILLEAVSYTHLRAHET